MTENHEKKRFSNWERRHKQNGISELVPASTVILIRDSAFGIEVLMLRKNSKVAFGGMWVFPGGKVDKKDEVLKANGKIDEVSTAKATAVRETFEEASIAIDPIKMTCLSHWVPPGITPRRFSTYFFITPVTESSEVKIDDSEIIDYKWYSPENAIKSRDAGEIELAAPTWMSLNSLREYKKVDDAIESVKKKKPFFYETHIGEAPEGPVAMWLGDAGYAAGNPSIHGIRHRLTMTPNSYYFEQTADQESP